MTYRLALEPEPFLARHWQREHLFIRGGFAPFEVPADADELAGLAMEPGVDARIIDASNNSWRLERGPFSADAFDRSGPWTLMAHGVDRHWDEAEELLGALPWLPRWRLDDVMMSYASDGGSAGPHYDNYDVFIIQGAGQRRWYIGDSCDEDSALLALPELRLLANFQARHEYLLETGDVLYIPPRCSHYGVSEGESTSFSIGFRAPRMSDLLARWTDNRLDTLADDRLLGDAGREAAARPGEITDSDLQRARQQLQALLGNDDPRWFGEAVTQSPDTPLLEEDTAELHAGSVLAKTPGARLAWYAEKQHVIVFANGNSQRFPQSLRSTIEALCAGTTVTAEELRALDESAEHLLHWLLEEGTIEHHDT